MAQILFASDATPSLVDLDAVLTDLYRLRELISDPNYTAATPVIRISSTSSNVLINTASSNGKLSIDTTGISGADQAIWAKNYAGATSPTQVAWNAATTGNNLYFQFYTETAATLRGSIDFNRAGTAVRYNTTSDIRLKRDIVDAPDAGAVLDAIKVRSFGWNGSDSFTEYGFVAQELHALVPDAVCEGDEGPLVADSKIWGVDHSKLVPLLVKEVQSLRQRVHALEAGA